MTQPYPKAFGFTTRCVRRLRCQHHIVETHCGNILEKLTVHGTADLILYAVRKGIIR